MFDLKLMLIKGFDYFANIKHLTSTAMAILKMNLIFKSSGATRYSLRRSIFAVNSDTKKALGH